jgi:hypothetical protein
MAQLTPSREVPGTSKAVSQSARVNRRAALTPRIVMTTLPTPDDRLEIR